MKNRLAIALFALSIATLACAALNATATPGPYLTPAHSVFDTSRTVYGFFPSPPELTIASVMATIQGIGQHGDVLLLQRSVPWGDFQKSADAASQDIVDARNLMILARQKAQ